MTQLSWLHRTVILALALGVAVMPTLYPWSQVLLTLALAKGLAVLGVVVLLQAGQVSFGHAMFVAIGAYSATFLGRALGGGDLVVVLLGGVLTSVAFGLVIGVFVVRYRYIFFGMLNLAFSMVLFSLLEKFFHITGGSDGLRVLRPTLFGQSLDRATFEGILFYLTLALALGLGWLVHRYLQSPLGQALSAVKSNETRLEYLGVSARHVLLVGYVVSAALCGLGGVIIGLVQGLVTPELGYWVRSGELVFIAILGGASNVTGAFAGALVFEVVRTYAAAFAANIWQMILGGVLLLIVLFAPGGLIALYGNSVKKLFARTRTEP
ncbi:MAG: branched-chain amino acid ABC transporter permease [Geminicoccaceae bacterium]|nr:MAG: branched-chain amino acid ABC transporter permease [Geminicoccaceae bacterium]